MKAQQIKIKEFKILKNFEAEINGNHILLLGDNGVGKSSVIQFLLIALGLQKNIPDNATGEGEVTFNLDGKPVKFSVKFEDGKPVIKVSGPGISISNKKSAIAELVGALDFDIDEFVELSKSKAGQKKQVEIFKSFLPKDIVSELNSLEAKVLANYNERTDLNKLIKAKEAVVNSHPLINHLFSTFEPVNVDEVYSELKIIQAKNTKIIEYAGVVENLKKEFEANKKEIHELKSKIDALIITAGNNEEKIIKGDEWLKNNPIQNIEDFEAKIKSASEANQKFNDHAKLKDEVKALELMKEESGELTAKIDSSKEAIKLAIQDMDAPIAGLSFDNDTLIYNGIPVSPDSLSTSEIMELGIRLKMAENPDLGILFIQRGESLGADRLKLIKDIADKANWQIIMEQVERGTKELHFEIMSA